MTYNLFGGMLNLAQSNPLSRTQLCCQKSSQATLSHPPAEQFNIIISVVKQWFDMLPISHIMELCPLVKLADDGLRCDYWAE